jgi:hypothetical protein
MRARREGVIAQAGDGRAALIDWVVGGVGGGVSIEWDGTRGESVYVRTQQAMAVGRKTDGVSKQR